MRTIHLPTRGPHGRIHHRRLYRDVVVVVVERVPESLARYTHQIERIAATVVQVRHTAGRQSGLRIAHGTQRVM